MATSETTKRAYCWDCEREQYHHVRASINRPWGDDNAAVWGDNIWEILECGGCKAISFLHSHWCSDDTDNDDQPVVRRDLYPPDPQRAKPDWAYRLGRWIQSDKKWVIKLYDDIYTALGTKSYGLAAMGLRTIADFVLADQVGDVGGFKVKLNAMRKKALITDELADALDAAIEAGNASAHRGYNPSKKNVFAVLDIVEALLHKFYIEPMLHREHAKAAAALRASTPPRS